MQYLGNLRLGREPQNLAYRYIQITKNLLVMFEYIPEDQFVSPPAYAGGLRGTETKGAMVGKI